MPQVVKAMRAKMGRCGEPEIEKCRSSGICLVFFPSLVASEINSNQLKLRFALSHRPETELIWFNSLESKAGEQVAKA